MMITKPNKTLRILFIAAEADPIIKVGGLGDVTGSLPRTLRALKPAEAAGYELDVRLAIPFHPVIQNRIPAPELAASFNVPHPSGPIPAQAYLTHTGELPVYLISGAPIQSDTGVYSLDSRKDGEKYTFFSLAVLEMLRALNWQPDILHANDWHTAIAVYALRLRHSDPFFAPTYSVLTVHNLPYMGSGAEQALVDYGITPARDNRLPWWGKTQPLPMGMSAADALTTVSASYAREILTPQFGCGLQEFLQLRAGTLWGIHNGLDVQLWDPATDGAIAQNFDSHTLDTRPANKQVLLRELDLPEALKIPLLVFIGRMDQQKGLDLALEALRQVAELPWQAAILGTGDPALQDSARRLEAEYPGRVKSIIRFDTALSRRMYAGGDMLLMPSRYEPCGLAQMIAMRYGCVPIARATGGLRDTIFDLQDADGSTGFLFTAAAPEALAGTLRRAFAAFANPTRWRARQVCGMGQDFSWQLPAQDYVRLYLRQLT
ncbi:MAG TPA: glycogen/starch synthase [Anaerolineaceae bacterium]